MEVKNDKTKNFAQVLSQEENHEIWTYLSSSYGIDQKKYQENYGFAKSKKGRIWIGSKTALKFVENEKFDPAKVLTISLGKSDSKKLLKDESMLIRLTLDGALFFNTAITKNIITLSENQEKSWSAGEQIKFEIENGVYIIASGTTNHIIGSTIAKEGNLMNFVPKWRRFPRPK